MKKVVLTILLLFVVIQGAQAQEVSEFQQRELIHKYITFPIEDWDKLTKINRHLVNENLIKMAKTGMFDLLQHGLGTDPKSQYNASASFLYAFLADYLAKKLGVKGEENRFYLARLYEERGVLDKSADICNNIILSEPDNVPVMVFLGNLFERMRMQEQAFIVYQRILKIDKNNVFTLFRLGLLYLELAQYKNAVDMFKRVLKEDPNNEFAKKFVDIYEGNVQSSSRPMDETKEKAVNHFILGERFFNQGKYSDAAQEYAKAIENDPHFSKAYVNLGASLIRQRKYDAAIGVLEQSVILYDNDPDAFYYMGLAYESQFTFNHDVNIINKAIENYQTALKINKEHRKSSDGVIRAEKAKADHLNIQ